MANGQKQVAFNRIQQEAYYELKEKKLVTETFSEFVRAAFYEKVRQIKASMNGGGL